MRQPGPDDSWAEGFPFDGDVIGATTFLRATAAHGDQRPFGHYLITRVADGQAIGGAGFKGQPESGSVEIGYGSSMPGLRGRPHADPQPPLPPSGRSSTDGVCDDVTVASWEDVERIASSLNGARPGCAHEGSPTYDIGRHHFARLRWDDGSGREILQFWTQDLETEQVYADRRDTFFRIDTFKVKVSVWAWLDRLDEEELFELLSDSWLARRGVRD